MRLYALYGDRASALRTYHTCVSVLRRKLHVEPHLRASEQVTEIVLAALDEKETTTLATQVMAHALSATVAAQFYQVSEGTPSLS